MESLRVSWQNLFHSFHRFMQYLVSSTVLLGTPFALALRIFSLVFACRDGGLKGAGLILMGGACFSDEFWVSDSSDFS